jgi:hypothetical protein
MRTTSLLTLITLSIGAALSASACANDGKTGGFAQGDDGGGGGSTNQSNDGGITSFGEGGANGAPIGTLSGKVTAPEGSIPISNALVYVAEAAPAALPSGAYCDLCVSVNSGAYTYTKADGTFSVPVLAKGKKTLVVQKGQFRKVRAIDLIEGDQPAPAEFTTLPAKTDDANGDHVPSMAIVRSDNDHIEVSLAKLGLGQIDDMGKYVAGSGPFDFYDVTMPGAATDYARLLAEPQTIAKYNVVFFPCGGNSGTTCNATDTHPGDAASQKTLRDWVASGGKLYVTDYSYEYVRQLWPGFVDWEGETNALGSACLSAPYDAPATVNDPGMSAWMTALGDTSFQVQSSWTRLSKVTPTMGADPNGMPTMITPTAWVSANVSGVAHPATVSFESQCGRVLFSTYHTQGSGGTSLLPQEKALLYVLLEVASVCAGAPVK